MVYESVDFLSSSTLEESKRRSLSGRRPRRTTRRHTNALAGKLERAARPRTGRKSPARRAAAGSWQSSHTLERSASPPALSSGGRFGSS